MPTESGIDAGQRSYAVFKDRWRRDDALLNPINLYWFVKVKQCGKKEKGKGKREKGKGKREKGRSPR